MSKHNTTKINTIRCKDLYISAMVETDECNERAMYYPINYLIMVEQGTFTLITQEKEYIIKEGETALIRKYTHGKILKTWKNSQEKFKDYVFRFYDEFIRDIIKDFQIPEHKSPYTSPLVKLNNNIILEGLKKSLEVYLAEPMELDQTLIQLKTKEALLGIMKNNPNLIQVFNNFSEPQKADLFQFMEHNFTSNISLEQFARASGRSLSTFNRDFRKTFQATPSKWLKTKRLEFAKKLITYSNRKPSEVYLEAGFEDLAHFSRSFKNYFGVNPSQLS